MPDNDPILERTLLISEADFRLVKLEIADGSVEHVLEVRDGKDAMGAERWRRFEMNGSALKALFKFLIRIAERETAACQQSISEHDGSKPRKPECSAAVTSTSSRKATTASA